VVGKFSPLHRGHEHLITRAIAACEQVAVIGYSQPAFPGCGRAQREAWVARRFPQVLNLQIDDATVRARCA
jgi:nicotinamide mononucleotide adenylyltransferase